MGIRIRISPLWLARTSRSDIFYDVRLYANRACHIFCEADSAGEPEEKEFPMRSTTRISPFIKDVGPLYTADYYLEIDS